MSGWNKDFAGDWWLKVVSSKYENQLEKEIHEKIKEMYENNPYLDRIHFIDFLKQPKIKSETED